MTPLPLFIDKPDSKLLSGNGWDGWIRTSAQPVKAL